MGGEFQKSATKDLFVVLAREPLEEFKLNNGACNNIFIEKVHKNQSRRLSTKKHILQCSQQISNANASKVQQLHSRNLQVCVVILEKLELGEALTNNKQNKRVNFSKDTILKPKDVDIENLVNTNTVKPNEERLPVYKQMVADHAKSGHDLYEFDEPDCDKSEDIGATQCKRKKKRKINKPKNLSKDVVKKRKVTKLKTGNNYNTIVQEIVQNVLKKVNKDRFEKKEHISVEKELHDKLNTDNNSERICIVPYVNITTPNLNNTNVNSTTPERNDNENNKMWESDCENNRSENLYFSTPLNPRKKINVISDVILNNTETFWFEDLEPNANSTIIRAEKCDPWRFNENLKRNPHYLCIKKTALPCLQQDMVLDYNLVKKIDKLFGRTTKELKNKENKKAKKMVATEIEYFSDSSNKENVPQLSLFDNENFVVQEKPLQDDLTENRRRRKVLGPILQNTVNIAKTTHFPEGNVSQNETLGRREVIEKPSTEESNINLVAQGDSNESDIPKLFEDEKPSFNFDENSKIYAPKVRKKKKLFFDRFEVLTQGTTKNDHVKPKNEMTKTEQAEFDEWAEKFNSMCEEVENYNLDIE